MKINTMAIFASGSGSNAENIIRHFSEKKMVKTVIIVTENPKAFVLERARRLNVKRHVLDAETVRGERLFDFLKQQDVDFIVLAGYLKLVPKVVVEHFRGRIVNIHPALLPKFGGKGMYGIRVHEAVLQAKEKESGITIHYVDTNYDEGSVIFQAKCPVIECDKPETLAERVHELEYEHYPMVLESIIAKL